MSSFLPTEKHSRDLSAYKINKITPVKRAMTKSNVLAFTKPKNRYIQQRKKRFKAVAADRNYQASKIIEMFGINAQLHVF